MLKKVFTMDISKFVQYIIVHAPYGSITFRDITGSCALSSFLSAPVMSQTKNFHNWKKQGMVKSVRRVTKKSIVDKILQQENMIQASFSFISETGKFYTIIIIEPMKYSDTPQCIKRLQVDAFKDCPSTSIISEEENKGIFSLDNPNTSFQQVLVVSLNPSVKMTAGKAASQCAHAGLQAFFRLSKIESQRDIHDFIVYMDTFGDFYEDYSYFIKDNGSKEVKPGTITCHYGFEFFDQDS